jgi:hypothetical protein
VAVALAAGLGAGILLGRATHRSTHTSTRTVVREARAQRGTIPRTFSGAYDPNDVPLQALIPERGRVHSGLVVPAAAGIPPEIVVTWDEDLGLDGIAVWQRRPGFVADWDRVYQRRQGEKSPFQRFETSTGDVTADGHQDLLVFEDQDGSGGWGTYRLLAVVSGAIRQLYVRHASSDWTAIRLTPRSLVVQDGIGKDPRSGSDIHCCPRFIRTRIKRWNGHALVDVKVTTHPARRRIP